MSKDTPATRGALLGTFVETRPVINKAIEDLMLNGSDPAAYMATVKTQLDAMLKEYNDLNS